jgi:hypothetical protein
MEWFSKIAVLTKLPLKFFVVAALVSGLLIYLPQPIIEKFHLVLVMEKYGAYVSILFLFCCGLLGIEICINVYQHIVNVHTARKSLSNAKEKIKNLDSKEASIIREFILNGTTITLPVDNPAVAELIDQGVLEQVGALGEESIVGVLCSLRLNKQVMDHITHDQIGLKTYVVDNSENNLKLTKEDMEWVRNNRPTFIHKIEEIRTMSERRLF